MNCVDMAHSLTMDSACIYSNCGYCMCSSQQCTAEARCGLCVHIHVHRNSQYLYMWTSLYNIMFEVSVVLSSLQLYG